MILEVVNNEAKNEEESLNKCLEQLNVNLNEVYYYTVESEGGLFSKKKYTTYMTTKYAVKEYVKNFLNELAKNMNTSFNTEVKESDGVISAVIVTDNNAVLIGKDGSTLSAIQTVIRQAIRNHGNFGIKVNLDVAGYKAKKEKNLAYEVKKIAKEVMKTKVDAKLDPMNSYERRIVHTVLADFKNIETKSEGEEPNRYTVIKYKESEQD